jgi:hypothetical protein
MTDLAAIPASRDAGTGARRLHDVLSGRLLPSVLFVAIVSCGGRVSGVGQGAEASGDASTAQDVDASSEANGDTPVGSFVLCSQEYGWSTHATPVAPSSGALRSFRPAVPVRGLDRLLQTERLSWDGRAVNPTESCAHCPSTRPVSKGVVMDRPRRHPRPGRMALVRSAARIRRHEVHWRGAGQRARRVRRPPGCRTDRWWRRYDEHGPDRRHRFCGRLGWQRMPARYRRFFRGVPALRWRVLLLGPADAAVTAMPGRCQLRRSMLVQLHHVRRTGCVWDHGTVQQDSVVLVMQ